MTIKHLLVPAFALYVSAAARRIGNQAGSNLEKFVVIANEGGILGDPMNDVSCESNWPA